MATVLVIDDDPGVRATVRDMLLELGHAVLDAEDGRAGLEAIERHPPDIVICDILMPEQDGLGVIRELSLKHPALPILAISGRYAQYLKIARSLGASAALLKPFRSTDLQDSVTQLLHERCATIYPGA
jgi:CheY-like chemotaxis protein